MARVWISRSEALDQLGVKPQTLYAYVSRGRISAKPDPEDPRKSLYAADDVSRLTGRSPGRSSGPAPLALGGGSINRGEATLDSAITIAQPDMFCYRGHSVIDLAEQATLERASLILWDCAEDTLFSRVRPRPDVTFPGTPRARALAILARRNEEDAERLSPETDARALHLEAASVLSEVVDGVAGNGPRLFLHQRLGRTWKVIERDQHLLRRALVLCADFGLDEACLAARATASGDAPLSASVLAGLCALIGPRLSGDILKAERLVSEARRLRDPRLAATKYLTEHGHLPGFGPDVRLGHDLRAEALLAAMTLPEDLALLKRIGEDLSEAPIALPMALALLSRALDLPREAPFGLYALGRSAGFLAHAQEQRLLGSPIRARLRYVGISPRAGVASDAA